MGHFLERGGHTLEINGCWDEGERQTWNHPGSPPGFTTESVKFPIIVGGYPEILGQLNTLLTKHTEMHMASGAMRHDDAAKLAREVNKMAEEMAKELAVNRIVDLTQLIEEVWGWDQLDEIITQIYLSESRNEGSDGG